MKESYDLHPTMARFYAAIGYVSEYGSAKKVADALGLKSPSQLLNWERRGISQQGMALIQEKYGINFKHLEKGDPPVFIGDTRPVEPHTEAATGSTLQPILAWEHESDLPEGEYVFIPRLDIHLSAGNGREQVEFDFVKKQPQAFRADWITEQRLNPSKLACLKVDGESMEPLLYHGETVVIDVSQNTVRDSKVYAIWYDGGERIKRLWKLPGGGLRIKSDNPQHDTIEVAPEHSDAVRVIGRVVHKSGTGGL